MILDFYTRKHSHVVRSTFAGELHAGLDGINQALVVSSVLTEMQKGPLSASQLADLQESGGFALPLHWCTDAKAVFDCLVADHLKTPSDANLLMHARKAREWIDRRLVTRLWWIDTRDMVTDGMTKGNVDRKAITELMDGRWKFAGDSPVRFPRV